MIDLFFCISYQSLHSLGNWYFSAYSVTSEEIVSMEDAGGSKLNGIKQIVRLKEMFQKWQTVTLGSKDSNNNSDVNVTTHHHHGHGGISPMINKRLTNNVVYCDSDEDSCHSPQPPHDVPKGYLAVYVGPELRRFIIPTSYLSHSLFKVLLEKAAEEFGFDQSGGLTIPCEIETFKYLLNCIQNHDDTSTGNTGAVEE